MTPTDNSVAFMSMDELIRDICRYLGDPEAKKLYIDVAVVVKHTLYAFNVHLSTAVKSVPITVGANMTASVPNDVVTFTKIGVCCPSSGKLKLLGRNDNLAPVLNEPFFDCCDCETTVSCSCTSEQNESACPNCTFHNINFNPTFPWMGPGPAPRYFYGYSPKMYADVGTWRHDMENNILIFSGGCDIKAGSVVIAEYAASTSVEQYQLVPRSWYFAVQHFVAHQKTKQQFEFREFRRHYSLVKKTLHTYTLEDIVNALRGQYKSSPKR